MPNQPIHVGMLAMPDLKTRTIKRIIDSHDSKEEHCELGEFDIIAIEDMYDHLVIKYFEIDEDDPDFKYYSVVGGPAYGFLVKIRRGHVRKLKAIYASLCL